MVETASNLAIHGTNRAGQSVLFRWVKTSIETTMTAYGGRTAFLSKTKENRANVWYGLWRIHPAIIGTSMMRGAPKLSGF